MKTRALFYSWNQESIGRTGRVERRKERGRRKKPSSRLGMERKTYVPFIVIVTSFYLRAGRYCILVGRLLISRPKEKEEEAGKSLACYVGRAMLIVPSSTRPLCCLGRGNQCSKYRKNADLIFRRMHFITECFPELVKKKEEKTKGDV